MGDVALTVDGTHVPWVLAWDNSKHREDYHNYKGWHSLLCLMFVNSFHMFVDGERLGTLAGNWTVWCPTIAGCCNSTKAVTRNDDELEVDKSLYSST